MQQEKEKPSGSMDLHPVHRILEAFCFVRLFIFQKRRSQNLKRLRSEYQPAGSHWAGQADFLASCSIIDNSRDSGTNKPEQSREILTLPGFWTWLFTQAAVLVVFASFGSGRYSWFLSGCSVFVDCTPDRTGFYSRLFVNHLPVFIDLFSM